MVKDDNNSKLAWLRFVTPILVSIVLFLVASIGGKVDKLDDKVFKHFTNDEIHMPRSMYVTKAEFDLHSQFQKDYFNNIANSLDKLEVSVRNRNK